MRKKNDEQYTCAVCSKRRKQIENLAIGGGYKNDWCILEGTGEVICPKCRATRKSFMINHELQMANC